MSSSIDTKIEIISKMRGRCRSCKKHAEIGDRVWFYPNAPIGRRIQHFHCCTLYSASPADASTAPNPFSSTQMAATPKPSTPAATPTLKPDDISKIVETVQKAVENKITADQLYSVFEKNHLKGIKNDFLDLEKEVKMTAAGAALNIEGALKAKLAQLVEAKSAEIAAAHKVDKTIYVQIPGSEIKLTLQQAHEQLPDLIALLQRRLDVYIFSELPGTGKSTAIRQAAKILDVPYYYVALSTATMPSELFGHLSVDGTYVPRLFREWYENGGVMDIAEMDNTNPNIFTLLNNALDNGWASFPDKMVARHEKAFIVGNGNTILSGPSDLFPSRSKQDAAAIDRFVFMEWRLDEQLEFSLVPAEFSFWATWVQGLRRIVYDRKDKLVVSPRATLKGASMLAEKKGNGWRWSVEQVADATVYKGRNCKAALMGCLALPKDQRVK